MNKRTWKCIKIKDNSVSYTLKEKIQFGLFVFALVFGITIFFLYASLGIHNKRMDNDYAKTQNSTMKYLASIGVAHRHEVVENGRAGFFFCKNEACEIPLHQYTGFEKFLNFICLVN